MNAVDAGGSFAGYCINHPRRETGLRCGKCADPICTACVVQTPVGIRCARCAQLKRPVEYDVSPPILFRAGAVGLAVSLAAWFVASFAPRLGFFIGIFIGAGVGEVISRTARRRISRPLEVVTVLCIVVGVAAMQVFRHRAHLGSFFSAIGDDPTFVISLLFPAVIASFVAVVKLR